MTYGYRISKKEHVHDLTGIGAGLHGGRWNPKGLNMVYTSSSIALASLEFLVHNIHILSSTSVCLAKILIGMPRPQLSYEPNDLPTDWNIQLSQQYATQSLGKRFLLEGKKYLLKVPSAIIPGEFNFLLNPNHRNHNKTEVLEVIDPFNFDQRILNLG